MSQCDQILAVLKDGRLHSIQEIHSIVGPCRLNSRVAELRRPERGGHDIRCKTESWWNASKRRREKTYFYRLVGSALDSGTAAVPLGAGRSAVSESSAAGEPITSLSPVRFAGPSLDEYGVDGAVREANLEMPGLIVAVDGDPVCDLTIEEQRAELAKLQQTLFGKAA